VFLELTAPHYPGAGPGQGGKGLAFDVGVQAQEHIRSFDLLVAAGGGHDNGFTAGRRPQALGQVDLQVQGLAFDFGLYVSGAKHLFPSFRG